MANQRFPNLTRLIEPWFRQTTPSSGGGILSGLYSARPPAGTPNRLYITTDGPIVWFDDGIEWRPMLDGGQLGYEVPRLADWADTFAGAAGGVFFDEPGQLGFSSEKAPADVSTSGVMQPFAGPATVTALARMSMTYPNPGLPGNNAAFVGLTLRNSGTGAMEAVLIVCFFDVTIAFIPTFSILVMTQANENAPYVEIETLQVAQWAGQFWLRVIEGVNRTWQVSQDGQDWFDVHQVAAGGFDQVGLTGATNVNNGCRASFSSFRIEP